MSRVILVSNRLPISVSETTSGGLHVSHSNGGLATALKPIFEQTDPEWIGWLGIRRHLLSHEIASLNLPEHLIPINFSDEEITHFYDRYSNGVLWPLLHGITPRIALTQDDLEKTHAVIQRYAAAVVQRVNPNDVIWIHDYLLFLLPYYLRQLGVKNRIGLFLHTPFFRPDTFSHTPETALLRESLACVDVFGVQTKRDVTFARECGVLASHFPIGVDFASFDAKAHRDAARQKPPKSHQQTILSLSRLDYTKGIPTQLRAIKQLAQQRQDFTYRLNVAPSRESVPEYQDLKREIETLVNEINDRYKTATWLPIDYTYQNLDSDAVCALFAAADIQLNVPIRDGMNLVAKEHVAASPVPKVLILSKEAGAAEQLTDALLVDPTDATAIVAALNQALDMPEQEKMRRWNKLRINVQEENVQKWSNDFTKALFS